MAVFAASVVVKIGLILVAIIVFIAVYGFLLDRLQRRGP
jgi:flagellar biogenesis protein FliO